MSETLYANIKRVVLAAIIMTDDRTPVSEIRHLAHDVAADAMRAVADEVRALDEVTLESVLFLLGQRA